jgi:hypothetical protein
VHIRGQSSLNEAQETESDSIEMTKRVMNFTEGIRVAAAGIRLSADSECYEQREAVDGQRL